MQRFPLEELTIVLLKKGISVEQFDCGDEDLNSFLKADSFLYSEQELAKTYVALYQNQPIAFISICADSIKLSKEEKHDEFGKDKVHSDYPALKIARLAVAAKYQRQNIGSALIEYAIGKAIEFSENVGCRFVTIDAYPEKLKFYAQCNFVQNQKDTSGQNVSMRLDLLSYKRAEMAKEKG